MTEGEKLGEALVELEEALVKLHDRLVVLNGERADA